MEQWAYVAGVWPPNVDEIADARPVIGAARTRRRSAEEIPEGVRRFYNTAYKGP